MDFPLCGFTSGTLNGRCTFLLVCQYLLGIHQNHMLSKWSKACHFRDRTCVNYSWTLMVSVILLNIVASQTCTRNAVLSVLSSHQAFPWRWSGRVPFINSTNNYILHICSCKEGFVVIKALHIHSSVPVSQNSCYFAPNDLWPLYFLNGSTFKLAAYLGLFAIH